MCEGYPCLNEWEKTPAFVIVMTKFIPQIPSCFPDLEPAEQRSLQYFELRTAPELAGQNDGFSAARWTSTMVQQAAAEACIRHALIAVGSAHEQLTVSQKLTGSDGSFALRAYNKALGNVIRLDLTTSTDALDVVLTSCILFAIYESLQGNGKVALRHITGGMKILSEHSRSRSKHLDSMDFHEEVLRSIMMRLDAQHLRYVDNSVYTAEAIPPFSTRPLCFGVLSSFKDVDHTRVVLDVLLHDYHSFIRGRIANANQGTSSDGRAMLHIEHARLTAAFSNWATTLAQSNVVQDSPAALLLRITHAVTHVRLCSNDLTCERSWDQFMNNFDMVVRLAEDFVAGRENRLPFTVTLFGGVVKPLSFVVHRCRDPIIRRRALRVLEVCNRREGLLDSGVAAMIYKRVVDLEEAEAFDAETGAVVAEKAITTASQIPERARISNVEKTWSAQRQRWRIIYQRAGSMCICLEEVDGD